MIITASPHPRQKELFAHVCVTPGNEAGLKTFGYTWDEFIALPSRKSCEEDVRAERESLLQSVREIDKTAPDVDYKGVSSRARQARTEVAPSRRNFRVVFIPRTCGGTRMNVGVGRFPSRFRSSSSCAASFTLFSFWETLTLFLLTSAQLSFHHIPPRCKLHQ